MAVAWLLILVMAVLFVLIGRSLTRRRGPVRFPSAATVVASVMVTGASFFLMMFMLRGGPTEEGTVLFFLLVLGIVAAFAWSWFREFTGLMAMGDECFPGRHDKLIWVGLMVFLPPVGLAAFRMFRHAYWTVEKQSSVDTASDLI